MVKRSVQWIFISVWLEIFSRKFIKETVERNVAPISKTIFLRIRITPSQSPVRESISRKHGDVADWEVARQKPISSICGGLVAMNWTTHQSLNLKASFLSRHLPKTKGLSGRLRKGQRSNEMLLTISERYEMPYSSFHLEGKRVNRPCLSAATVFPLNDAQGNNWNRMPKRIRVN